MILGQIHYIIRENRKYLIQFSVPKIRDHQTTSSRRVIWKVTSDCSIYKLGGVGVTAFVQVSTESQSTPSRSKVLCTLINFRRLVKFSLLLQLKILLNTSAQLYKRLAAAIYWVIYSEYGLKELYAIA